MDSSKMYYPSWCRYRTYQCKAAKYRVSWGVVKGPEWKYAEFRGYQSSWYRVCGNERLYEKEATGMDSSKCITLVGADTVPTSAGPQSTPFDGE